MQILKLLLLFPLQFASGLECYSCSTIVDPKNYNYDCLYFYPKTRYNEYKKRSTCLNSNEVCAKYEIMHGGSKWVYRSCHNGNICADLQYRMNNGFDQLVSCNVCQNEDLCNFSLALIPSSFLVFTLIVILSSL